ncbi:SH3 domain-containing protein [Kutzneria sp. NPDC052558]|uniref:SH3 domain-containing protein n=1 Tax=Kutzneria sp. NPDC052558 TaxID=3364121 RepID=UPI0037C98A88
MVMVKSVLVAASVASLVGPAQAPASVELGASAHASGAVTAVAARPKSGGLCNWFNADGVNIRSAPSTSGAVLGLAYYADPFKVAGYEGGQWQEGTDLRTGVHGWASAQFITLAFSDC